MRSRHSFLALARNARGLVFAARAVLLVLSEGLSRHYGGSHTPGSWALHSQ